MKVVPVKSWHLDVDGAELPPVPPNVELPTVGNFTDAIDDKGVLWGEVKIQARSVRGNELLVKCNCIFDIS
jgi:hypothetical protein